MRLEAAKCGISSRQFWRMTLHEFMIWRRGYYDRMYDQRRIQAWALAYQLGIWTKDPISPALLLGEEQIAPSFCSPEEMRERMRAKQAKLAGEDI